MVQQLENSGENYQRTRNESLLTPDWNKESTECHKNSSKWRENEGTDLDQARKNNRFSDRIVSNAAPVEDKNELPKNVSCANEMLINSRLP